MQLNGSARVSRAVFGVPPNTFVPPFFPHQMVDRIRACPTLPSSGFSVCQFVFLGVNSWFNGIVPASAGPRRRTASCPNSQRVACNGCMEQSGAAERSDIAAAGF